MKPKKITKPSDDVIKLVAGVILATSSIVGIATTFLSIVDLSLTRKILVASIAFLVWVLVEFFAWRVGNAPDKRKTSWALLLDLIVAVRNEVNPDTKRIFQKELFIRISRWALISLITVIIVAGVYKAVEEWAGPFIEPPTPTFTPTQTLTLTPSPTATLTPTTPVISDFLYYMIVLDASEKMKESFHGQSKWQVALNTVTEIINGLNPNAKYGLVVVGGSNSSGIGDPCGDPSTPALPFSSRETVWNDYSKLQPQGGGSFYTAFVLAKTQLEGLSRDTIRTLIYITGSSDTCESKDEWAQLKNIVNFPDTTIGLFSQIIILDDNGLKSQTLADQFNSLSKNVNAQAPKNILDTQRGGATVVNVVNNVTTYVNTTFVNSVIIDKTTDAPALTLTPTITPQLGSTTAVPTTPVVIPTTPTFTPTKTPTPISPTPPLPPTATLAPSVELLSYNYLQPGIGCQVDINVQVRGSPATGSFHVWNANYPPEGDIYAPTTLQLGTYNNNLVTLGGLEPKYFRHNVWFEYNGTSSNVLTDLVCPGLTPSP